MTEDITPKRARRLALKRLLQKVQHAVPGVVLMGDGLTGLRRGLDGWHTVLSIAEIAASGAVFISLVLALRALRVHAKANTAPHEHTGINWIDIMLAAMLFTEAWAKYVENGRIAGPTILLGVVMIILGVLGSRLANWKASRHDEGPAIAVLARSVLHKRASKSSTEHQ